MVISETGISVVIRVGSKDICGLYIGYETARSDLFTSAFLPMVFRIL